MIAKITKTKVLPLITLINADWQDSPLIYTETTDRNAATAKAIGK
jgi:hypothetical protein